MKEQNPIEELVSWAVIFAALVAFKAAATLRYAAEALRDLIEASRRR